MNKSTATVLSWVYAVLLYGFIFLPVAVLVLFSFQDGRLPVPPFMGFSTKWYQAIFADSKLMSSVFWPLMVLRATNCRALPCSADC